MFPRLMWTTRSIRPMFEIRQEPCPQARGTNDTIPAWTPCGATSYRADRGEKPWRRHFFTGLLLLLAIPTLAQNGTAAPGSKVYVAPMDENLNGYISVEILSRTSC